MPARARFAAVLHCSVSAQLHRVSLPVYVHGGSRSVPDVCCAHPHHPLTSTQGPCARTIWGLLVLLGMLVTHLLHQWRLGAATGASLAALRSVFFGPRTSYPPANMRPGRLRLPVGPLDFGQSGTTQGGCLLLRECETNMDASASPVGGSLMPGCKLPRLCCKAVAVSVKAPKLSGVAGSPGPGWNSHWAFCLVCAF